MKCYIYKIINQVTLEKYVGQTTNFSRRKETHVSALNNNHHPNPKLQNAWNKYGKENFIWEVEKFDLTKEELDKLEIDTIKLEKSFTNGYNLTEGGTGGNTRYNRLINFEQYCVIYAGNTKFDGMTAQTGRYYGCDSSTISAIKRNVSYDDYRELYNNLSEEEKQKYLNEFIKIFELDKKAPPKREKNLTDEQVVDFLCLISCYGKGAEVAFLRAVNHGKGLGHCLKTKPTYFVNAKKIYNSLSMEEIQARAEKVHKDYEIQSHLTYNLSKNKELHRVDCAL